MFAARVLPGGNLVDGFTARNKISAVGGLAGKRGSDILVTFGYLRAPCAKNVHYNVLVTIFAIRYNLEQTFDIYRTTRKRI